MLLCVDIGNSSIKFGVFAETKLSAKLSIPTKREYTAAEIAREIGGQLPSAINAAIVCSVVSETDAAITKFISDSFKLKPRFVRSTDDLGLKINFNVESTGADRLVNSFAAAEKYGTPCVVISFGTATTIDTVNKEREYLGGLIAPGMKVTAKALSMATSKLPEVQIEKPSHVIAQTTERAINSGIVYGQIAMAEGLIKKVIAELGDQPRVIATGGFAELISSEIDVIHVVDIDLTLDGLNMLSRSS